MLNTLWLADTTYASQYNLINDFIAELGRAAQSAGLGVNLSPRENAGLRPAAVYFNYAPGFPEQARRAAREGDACAQPPVLHWLIDHPLSLRSDVWRQVEQMAGYRLLTVSDDDTQLLALHYPRLRQARCWHGVDPGALCDAASIEGSHSAGRGRDIDVLVTGTVATDTQLEEMRAMVPAGLRVAAEDIARLRLEHPWMSFTQAWELCAPTGLHSQTHWDLLHAVFVYTTAVVNSARRLALVRSLGGLSVTVLGKGPWQSAGTRGLTVVPEVAYRELPAWFARARVALAVNPTQFVHGFSERLLLSLAGGAASVTDDRLWVRREFGACTERFAVERPEACRAAVEGLLSDRGRAAAMGAAGRAVVAGGHLWRHRLQTVALVASHAGAELGWSAAKPEAARV